MPEIIELGSVKYTVYTENELIQAGIVKNPNMWIDSGWIFCVKCNNYRFHFAMSHIGGNDCYEICQICKTYSGKNELNG